MIDVRHDAEQHRFVATIDGQEAQLLYHPVADGVLEYASTFVPETLRGRGIASAIVRRALDYAREHGYRVIPSCWFVREFLDQHPEYADLAVTGKGEGGSEKG